MRPTASAQNATVAIRPDELRRAIAPEEWLGPTTDRFAQLDGRSVAPIGEDDVSAFFASRMLALPGSGPHERAMIPQLIDLDVRTIAHALSLLLSGQGHDTAMQPLSKRVRGALENDPPQLDHVGIEIFGKLEWYLDTLAEWERRGVVRLGGYRVFPSVQVRQALADDPDLRDVRIARVYIESEARDVNLELFEVSQHWLYTVARQVSLFADTSRGELDGIVRALSGWVSLPLDPVAHLALGVRRWQTVEHVHRILSDPDVHQDDTRLYGQALSYNHGDESLNCKFLTRSATLGGKPVFGRVTELISYGVHTDPRDPGAPAPAGGI